MTSRQLRKSPNNKFNMYPDSVYHLQEEEDLHPKMLAAARKSGQLNLSNRGLVAVPEKVWTIMEPTAEPVQQRPCSCPRKGMDNYGTHGRRG